MSEICMICGEGEITEKEEKDYVTYVHGIKMLLPVAIVGTCNKCGVVNYAIRKDIYTAGAGEPE
jgi:hypothetical protein